MTQAADTDTEIQQMLSTVADRCEELGKLGLAGILRGMAGESGPLGKPQYQRWAQLLREDAFGGLTIEVQREMAGRLIWIMDLATDVDNILEGRSHGPWSERSVENQRSLLKSRWERIISTIGELG